MGENLRNVRPKAVVITLDKERHLLYDLNAFAELEEVFGTVEEALKALESGKLKAFRAILWCGLIHEDEEISITDVGALIGLADMEYVATALNEAISSAMPQAKAEVKKGKEKEVPKE